MQEYRKVTKFLLLPKSIGNTTKWLVTATWEEIRYKINPTSLLNPFGIGDEYWSNWKPTKFV